MQHFHCLQSFVQLCTTVILRVSQYHNWKHFIPSWWCWLTVAQRGPEFPADQILPDIREMSPSTPAPPTLHNLMIYFITHNYTGLSSNISYHLLYYCIQTSGTILILHHHPPSSSSQPSKYDKSHQTSANNIILGKEFWLIIFQICYANTKHQKMTALSLAFRYKLLLIDLCWRCNVSV